MKATSITEKGLELTAEEAFAILDLCMTSPDKLDATAERAMHKLAEFCRHRSATPGAFECNERLG